MPVESYADRDLCAPLPHPPARPDRRFTFTAVLRDRDTDTPLRGAEYGLFERGRLLCAATSDDGGVLAFHGLTPGPYELRELSPPPGYLCCAGVYAITVGPASGAATGFTLRSVFLPRLRFYLLDARTQAPLSGASFLLSNGAEAVSGPSGLVDLGLIPPGTYTVRQVSAPGGYLPLPTPLAVSVSPHSRVTVNAQPLSKFCAYNPPAS